MSKPPADDPDKSPFRGGKWNNKDTPDPDTDGIEPPEGVKPSGGNLSPDGEGFIHTEGAQAPLPEVPPNWDRVAWAASAREYAANRPAEARRPTARSLRIRRLVQDPVVSLDRLWRELQQGRRRMGASKATLEALMLGLRYRGVAALSESAIRARIKELSREQYREVMDRLLRPAPHWTPWPHEDVKKFSLIYKELSHG